MRPRDIRRQQTWRKLSDKERQRRLREWRRMQRARIEREVLRLDAHLG
jgi:hypothetical protein